MFISNWTNLDCGRALYGKYQCLHPIHQVVDLTGWLIYDTILLQIDSGLMTPTMKIRRDKVVDQYKEQIEELYKK